MLKSDLKIGGRYNWKNQPEPTKVWCEVRAEDLASFEETKEVQHG